MSPNDTPIPQPSHKDLGADPPAASRYCAAHPTGVAGLIRLPRAEVFAAEKACLGRPSCAVAATSQRPLGLRVWRCGLLAAVALCAWQSAASQAPTLAPKPETVVVQGVVLDDSLNVPVPGLFLYLNQTKYGAITDAQGKFSFSFPTAWKPVRGGVLSIQATPVPYTFKEMRVQLDWRTHDPAHTLTMRLASAPGRGRPHLHGFILIPPPVPPPVYPASARTARP
jgi:hypothetical protein